MNKLIINNLSFIKIFILILISLSLFRTLLILWNSLLLDFGIFYSASSSILNGINPYTDTGLFTRLNYPPISLLIFYPLHLLPFILASKVWIILSVGFLFVTILLLHKLQPVSSLTLCLISLFTVISFPFKFTLGMGQINLLILLLIVSSIYLLENKKYIFAGLLLGISVMVKLFPVVYLIPLLIKKNRKIILYVSISILFLVLVSIILLGRDINIYYVREILPPLFSNHYGGAYYNQSITGTFERLNIPFSILLLSRILIFLYTIYNLVKLNKNLFYDFSLLIVTVLLINSFTWQHHLVLLILPYYYLVSKIRTKLFLTAVFISYLLSAYNIKNPVLFTHTFVGNLILSHGFFGILMLWIILVVENRTKE